MRKKIFATVLAFSVSGILAPVAQANPVHEEPMWATQTFQSPTVGAYSGGLGFWDRVVGVTTSYIECEAVLVRRVLKYGKIGVCVPDPRKNGTWLVMLT